jgi:peptidoglycan LD-endopeptidase CwlK
MKKQIILFLLFAMTTISFATEKYDSDKILKKEGAPDSITSQMVALEVEYIDYNGKEQKGVLVVNKKVAKEIAEIFKEIKNSGFQIEKIIPISEYSWDDDKSMFDNNSSGYNYRFVANSKKLSNHSFGMAIDINPKYNPMIIGDKIYPPNGIYNSKKIGTITADSEVVKIFKKRGWNWGGDYKSLKDYQHFDKTLN